MKKKVIGWIEWVALPDLPIKRIKAKIDTGARTSALHAENIRIFSEGGARNVTFTVYPSKEKDKGYRITCPLKEKRLVKSSNGIASFRPVITTTLRIGSYKKKIELTLINREPMEFRMLLGRRALRDFYVDPRHGFLLSPRGSHL